MKKIINELKKEIDSTNGKIIIQAGHFALIHDTNDILIPAIYQDIKNKEKKELVKFHHYMGTFPIKSLKIAINLIKYAKSKRKKINLIFLINDWQWVKPVKFGYNNSYREEFYKKEEIPNSFLKLFKKNKISKKIILPFKNKYNKQLHKYFFGESKLRNQYKKHFKACNLNNACAQEQIPLFNNVKNENAKLFINFVPKSCILPTKEATEYFFKKNSSLKIKNIFF